MVSATDLANLLGAAFAQANRLLRLQTPLGHDVLMPERLQAVEQLDGGGFRIELTAVSDDAGIEAASLLGQAVRVDLLTQRSRDTLRPFHGHVTRFERLGANGGLARYRMVIEPWLAFLRHRRDSFLFQDMSVVEVVDSVFGDYNGQGKLVPAWRWALRDAAAYPRRSIVTQYEESDFDFVTRLLAEEGLFYYFEHEAAQGESLGAHRMVIADADDVFQDNEQPSIRFGRADATAAEDVIDRWQGARRLQTNAVAVASWDYRAKATRSAEAGAQDDGSSGPALQDTDYPGQYWLEDGEQAQRHARQLLEALEVRRQTFSGEGSVRTLAPATRFMLTGHYDYDRAEGDGERRFVLLGVRHEARNNLNERFRGVIGQLLGSVPDGLPLGSAEAAETPFYRNRFDVVLATVPYHPQLRDAHGRQLHPRPTVTGAQTAIVVGAGGPVHTDRDHRVKVQFHWQRGARSASRLSHPVGDDNARAEAGLGTWIRVATPVAGPNWGGVALPRVGQEVVVEFQHGDIDRPVVIGAAYNGRGQDSAQYNQNQTGAANATGNAPAWFAGSGEAGEGDKETNSKPAGQQGHAHNAVLSGIKTQALGDSQNGTGGYNQLVFDDTAGQSRTLLSTTQAASALTLGHHLDQRDNARQAGLGHGAALETADSGALRGGAGMLLTAHGAGTGVSLLDSEPAAAQAEASTELLTSLADVARKHKAGMPEEPAAAELPAIAQLKHTGEVLRHAEPGADGKASATAYNEPHLQVSAPKGIAVTTPADAVLVAGTQLTVAAQKDANVAAGGDLSVAVGDGISLFAHGKTSGQAAQATPGIAMHAANGKVGVASLQGESRIAAEKLVTVSSTQGAVNVQAKDHVLLNAAGAQIRVMGNTIEVHAPGMTTFKGAQHLFVGPGGSEAGASLPKGELPLCEYQTLGAESTGAGIVPIQS
ncbi:type VI secretion system Vgr family protein [Cupriavidus necator]|uniref:type VI secretion system Vgr family protein n=1 Tax=Cupriavidus necator TaxID=106590 RepID=UPI00339D3692